MKTINLTKKDYDNLRLRIEFAANHQDDFEEKNSQIYANKYFALCEFLSRYTYQEYLFDK